MRTVKGLKLACELTSSDVVFGLDGRPTCVVEVSLTRDERACRIEFDTGDALITGVGQRWIIDLPNRPGRWLDRPTTMDVAQMTSGIADMKVAQRLAPPLVTQPVPLPIHPYLLGVWLAVGDPMLPVLRSAPDPLRASLRARGVYLGVPKTQAPATPVVAIGAARLIHRKLDRLDLIANKHIPDSYLRGSIDQRLELLRGMLDAAGSVQRGGRLSLRVREPIAPAACELIASLGCAPVVRVGDGRTAELVFRGADHMLTDGRLISHLRQSRVRDPQLAKPRRLITSISEVSRRSLVRICVAAPDDGFVATRSYLPIAGEPA